MYWADTGLVVWSCENADVESGDMVESAESEWPSHSHVCDRRGTRESSTELLDSCVCLECALANLVGNELARWGASKGSDIDAGRWNLDLIVESEGEALFRFTWLAAELCRFLSFSGSCLNKP